MMKKFFFSIAFMCALFSNAQTIETKSNFDSNTDGKVDKADVTNTANKVLGKSADEKQVVDAEDVSTLFKRLNARLSAIEANITAPEPTLENGHEYVDLGLSVKWATMNVGATEVAGSKTHSHTGKLDCYGEYYAWGETSAKDSYTWSNLKYCSSSSGSAFTKYVKTDTYGTVDNKTTLELSDDAARANWGGTWRMPTKTELQELKDNCYWEWTTSYKGTSVVGYIVYKVKSDSDKGAIKYGDGSYSKTVSGSYSTSNTHIFLPAAGYRQDSNFKDVGGSGYYWSNTLMTYNSSSSYYLFLATDWIDYSSLTSRQCGHSVRAVCP